MFGKRIMELRTEKGITQSELAKIIGISRSALSLYEIEKREPDIDTLNKLATFFDVWVDYLIGHSDQRNSDALFEYRYISISNRLGNILNKYRENHNLSEIDFAKKLDITLETYTGIEAGKYTPSLNLLRKLAEIMGYDLDYLTGAIDHTTVQTNESIKTNGKILPISYSESDLTFRANFEKFCFQKSIDIGTCEKELSFTKDQFIAVRYNRMPTLSELLKISYAAGTSMDYLIGKTDIKISNINEDELELLLNYRDCLPHYKKNILSRAKDLSIESIPNYQNSSVAADDQLRNTGTDGIKK